MLITFFTPSQECLNIVNCLNEISIHERRSLELEAGDAVFSFYLKDETLNIPHYLETIFSHPSSFCYPSRRENHLFVLSTLQSKILDYLNKKNNLLVIRTIDETVSSDIIVYIENNINSDQLSIIRNNKKFFSADNITSPQTYRIREIL